MKIGFQMDQLSALNFKTDSTLPLIYESQKRKNTNYIFHPNDLHFQKNKVLAQSSQIKFTSANFKGYKLGPKKNIRLRFLRHSFCSPRPPVRYVLYFVNAFT